MNINHRLFHLNMKNNYQCNLNKILSHHLHNKIQDKNLNINCRFYNNYLHKHHSFQHPKNYNSHMPNCIKHKYYQRNNKSNLHYIVHRLFRLNMRNNYHNILSKFMLSHQDNTNQGKWLNIVHHKSNYY